MILNKPGNVWGGDSGSNDKKVTIGLTYVKDESGDEILGTDMVR